MQETEWFEGIGVDTNHRLIVLPWIAWAAIAFAAIIAPLALTGCASSRYLSEEQDAKMRELCDKPGGCSIIQGEQWQQIEQLLRRLGITPEEI